MSRSETKDFELALAQRAAELRLEIEAKCSGFKTDHAARKERIKRVQHDYQFFAQTYFPHYIDSESSLFHDFLFDELPKLVDNTRGIKEAIAAPRGNAKSTLVTQIFVMWCLITERKRFAVILMDALDQAAMMLEAIKVEYESNPRLAMDFPDHVGQGRVWQAGVIVTAKNQKLQIGGTGKKVRGWRHGAQRPDLVVLDDIENDENVRQKSQRDKIESWLKKAVMKLGPPDGTMDMIYLGTVLHYDSVLNRTIKSPTWRSKVFKAIIEWPDRMDLWQRWEELYINEGEEIADAYYTQNKAIMDAGAVVIWPATQPLLMLMKYRADDQAAFDSEYQNDPTNSEHAPFRDLQYWVQESRDWVFYGAVDPSLGKRNISRDPSAILVGGYDRNHGVLDIVEAVVARQLPDKIIQDVIRLQQLYNCLVWGVEAVQFQEFLRTEMMKAGIAAGVPIPTRAIIPNTDKSLRIESLQPHVANAYIRSHRRHTVLNEQLIHWPEADHDDGIDALQILWMIASTSAGGVPAVRSGKMKRK